MAPKNNTRRSSTNAKHKPPEATAELRRVTAADSLRTAMEALLPPHASNATRAAVRALAFDVWMPGPGTERRHALVVDVLRGAAVRCDPSRAVIFEIKALVDVLVALDAKGEGNWAQLPTLLADDFAVLSHGVEPAQFMALVSSSLERRRGSKTPEFSITVDLIFGAVKRGAKIGTLGPNHTRADVANAVKKAIRRYEASH